MTFLGFQPRCDTFASFVHDFRAGMSASLPCVGDYLQVTFSSRPCLSFSLGFPSLHWSPCLCSSQVRECCLFVPTLSTDAYLTGVAHHHTFCLQRRALLTRWVKSERNAPARLENWNLLPPILLLLRSSRVLLDLFRYPSVLWVFGDRPPVPALVYNTI